MIRLSGLAFLLAVSAPAFSQEGDTALIGKAVKDFKLKDLLKDQETLHSIAEYKGKKHVVLIWISEQCDVTWRYEKRTGELMKQFGKDVQFFAVAGSSADTPVSIRKYAESKNYGMPVLDDVKSRMTQYFGVKVTPTYLVIDKEGVLRYRGACDDLQCGGSYKAEESAAKEKYVQDALKALLEGKAPAVTEKKGIG